MKFTNRLTKFLAPVISGVMVLGTFLTGCSDTGKTKITLLNHKIEAAEGYKKIIKAFEKVHPDVKVELISSGGEADTNSAIKSKLSEGSGKSALCMWNVASLGEMALWEDYLMDLSGEPWCKMCPGWLLDGIKDKNGRIMGMPVNVEGYGLVINRKMFEDAGVDVNSMFTFKGQKEGFDKLKKKIDSGEMKDKYPNLKSVMALPAKEAWVLGNHMLNPILAKEFKSPREAFEAPTVGLKAADLYKQEVDFQSDYTEYTDDKSKLNSINYQDSMDNGFLMEKYAAVQQGNWILSTVKLYDDKNKDAKMIDKLDMISYNLPDGSTDGMYVVFPGQFWVVNKNISDDQRKASKDFLKFMYDSQEAKDILEKECMFISPFEDVNYAKTDNLLNQRIIDAVKEKKVTRGDLALAGPQGEGWSKHVVGSGIQKYLAGFASWDSVMNEARTKWADMRKGGTVPKVDKVKTA